MSLSERKPTIFKRHSGDTELEGSNIKRIRLDDDDESDSLERTVSSSSLAYSASDSGGFSTVLTEENDNRSSGCSSSTETNEIATDTHLPFLDLEAHQISETEISTLITNNFRKQEIPISEMESVKKERREQEKTEKKYPTQAELDVFFSAAERYEQKRFTEKYNYDIVNDTPLEGRYQWVSLKP